MADDILKELFKLESLSQSKVPSLKPSKSKSKSTPSSTLQQTFADLEQSFQQAEQAASVGSHNLKHVLNELKRTLDEKRGDADKSLKEWYGALGKVGKAIDKVREQLRGGRVSKR